MKHARPQVNHGTGRGEPFARPIDVVVTSALKHFPGRTSHTVSTSLLLSRWTPEPLSNNFYIDGDIRTALTLHAATQDERGLQLEHASYVNGSISVASIHSVFVRIRPEMMLVMRFHASKYVPWLCPTTYNENFKTTLLVKICRSLRAQILPRGSHLYKTDHERLEPSQELPFLVLGQGPFENGPTRGNRGHSSPQGSDESSRQPRECAAALAALRVPSPNDNDQQLRLSSKRQDRCFGKAIVQSTNAATNALDNDSYLLYLASVLVCLEGTALGCGPQ